MDQILCTSIAHWLLGNLKTLCEPTPQAHTHQDGVSHHPPNSITPPLNPFTSSTNSPTNAASAFQNNSPYPPLTLDRLISSTSDACHHEPNPVTPPRVYFLSMTNSTANAASSSQKNSLCPALTYYPPSNPSSDDDDDSSLARFIPEKFKIQVTGLKRIKHYRSDYEILLVGGGDFSFSASLAHATNLTATSLDSLDFLLRNYRNAFFNIIALKNNGATVLHGFDATEMANLSPFKYMHLDRVVYNFPLAGFFPSQSRKDKIRQNQTLVELFLENAKKMTDINGEIHITHKCNGFFLKWDLEARASRVGLRLKNKVHFDLSDYLGYNTKYGFGGDKNFDCDPGKTYKFVHRKTIKHQDFV